jgi:hypothetical protein
VNWQDVAAELLELAEDRPLPCGEGVGRVGAVKPQRGRGDIAQPMQHRPEISHFTLHVASAA